MRVPVKMQASAVAIPIVVLTGFLGSGKTSLLNRALRNDTLSNSLVMVNEIGEIGIDHDLIVNSSEDVVLLTSGCVCCSIRGDLRDELLSLSERMKAGEVRLFDAVIIETSGLSDPTPILHTIASLQAGDGSFFLSRVMTTFDACLGVRTLGLHDVSRKQLLVADIVVITKEDLADRGAIDRLRIEIAGLNQSAEILSSNAFIAGLGGVRLNDVGAGGARTQPSDGNGACPNSQIVRRDCRHDSSIAHDNEYASVSVRLDRALEPEPALRWLQLIAKFRGEDLVRAKGILNIGGAPFAVHIVQHMLFPLSELDTWPSEDKQSRLVFIAKNLSAETIRRTLEVVAAEMEPLDA